MSALPSGRPEFGEGTLSRGAALIYHLLVVELLLLATGAPGLIALVLLGHDASNAPLAVACALPLGPALSAALFALHHRRRELADLTAARSFWRGYRLNVVAVSKIWVPWLGWISVVAVNLAHFGRAGVPGWWAALLVLTAIVATLWVINAVVITSLFTFRARDVARLALYFLIRTPGVTLGNAAILVAATAVTAAFSEGVLALAGSLLAMALLRTAVPMTTAVRDQFTA